MKPILFNTPMVRAILEGRKTQTRRIAKWQEEEWKSQSAHFRYGDILYVRETWAEGCTFSSRGKCFYRADGETDQILCWRPSIHMPKELARIFLRVNDVRFERLQAITKKDALQEGAAGWEDFVRIWESTIKATDRARNGWDANPWVFVYELERISREEAEA